MYIYLLNTQIASEETIALMANVQHLCGNSAQ